MLYLCLLYSYDVFTILLESFEVKKMHISPLLNLGIKTSNQFCFLIKNETQININNIYNDIFGRYINAYTFNVQIYHTSSFKKIKMSGLQINHTIIWKCHLSIPVYIQNMIPPGTNLLKKKLSGLQIYQRSSNNLILSSV